MITNSRSNSKMQNDIKTAQVVTDERISEEEYAPIKAERQAIRDRINELEGVSE